MAYTSKYTGPEIDRRLEQGTYDDAVAAGFTGSKEEFYKQLAAYNPQEQEKLNNKQDKEDSTLETENKSIVGAINEINSIKQDKVDDRLTTDSKIIVEAINEVKYNTIVLEQNKQPREDLGFSTKQKTVVGAVNELNLKIGELDESKQNAEDDRLDTNDTTVIGAINEINDNLKAEIERSKTIDDILETLNIKQVTPDSENYASAYELQDSTGKVYGSRINITKDQFLKNVSYENNILTLTFILADGTESTQQVDLTGLVDEYIAGAGISVTTTDDGKKVINIADDALQKIQYADSEVRRLEQDKIPYAYDEKTQSNINVILPEGGSYLGNYGDENATVAKAAVYDGVKQLELGSSKVHTNINTDSDVTIETSTGKKTIATTDELVNVVNIPIRSLQDKVYTQEEIFDWFGVTSVPELKQKISRGSQMYLCYGILLSGNPMYYKMPIEYTAFESANQIKLVLVGLDIHDDVTSKYEIIMNLDGTIIEGNSNVKVTITSIESGDIDLSKYQTIDDDSLTTSAKTIPAAINEIKESVDSISDPYEINLTNLLSAEDSESISTAIGGIDNLNATVQDNRIIVGTISNGSVSVSIRILGNVTTLYYLLDSVVGLTLNEIAITNTSGTLSKSVTTHSVLTENMVINSLTSDETTLPLSAAQGKALNEKILNSGKIYVIDGSIANADNPTSEQISEAIGGWDNLVNAIQNNWEIVVYETGLNGGGSVPVSTYYYYTGNAIKIMGCVQRNAITQIYITNTAGTLSLSVQGATLLSEEDDYSELQTTDKTIIGSINEINTLANSKADSQDITDAINALDKAEVSAGTGEIISAVSQENGIVNVSKRSLTSDDIPTLPQSKIEDLSTELDAKQNATDDTLGTTAKTIVGAINEILPRATGVGKPSFNIGGEIFNNYADNQASGNYAHAEGSDTKASGDYSHAEGYQTTASGNYSHAEGKYNYDDSSAIHMIGIGTSSTDRKNAHVIDLGGDHYVYGVGGFDGTNSESAKSLQEVINNDKAENFTVGTGLEMTPERVLNITTDLTSYLKSTDAANTYLSKTDAASTYATAANLTAHTGNTENPHNVTALQVGLGNVDNTSDEDKPVSTAQQTALDLKQNITDNTLQTTAKTIVGAINEVNGKVKDDTIILYSNTYSLTSWTTAYNNANSALALALTNAFNNYNHIILRDGNKTDTTFYEYHVTQIAVDNGQYSTKYFKYSTGLADTTWWLITLMDYTVVIQNIQ